MKSRITIDINESNEPVIQIEYIPSEDVRDKMVKRFLDRFGSLSSWAYFSYTDGSTLNSKATLLPIIPERLSDEAKTMTAYVKYMQEKGYIGGDVCPTARKEDPEYFLWDGKYSTLKNMLPINNAVKAPEFDREKKTLTVQTDQNLIVLEIGDGYLIDSLGNITSAEETKIK